MSFNTNGAIGGAASGATSGAMIGGPWGAAVGGVVGGLAGGFLGGSGQPYDPTKQQATLAREQYNQWLDMYSPVEDMLYARAANWDGLTESAQNTALQRTGQKFEQSEESTNRQLRGYGITLTPEQKASTRRRYDIAAATSAVNAANMTGRAMDQQESALLGG